MGAKDAVMKQDRVWIVVLVSGFVGLMVDGMDFMFLVYSLPSLMQEFQISKVEAGSLAMRHRSRRKHGGPLATLNPDVAARVTTDG